MADSRPVCFFLWHTTPRNQCQSLQTSLAALPEVVAGPWRQWQRARQHISQVILYCGSLNTDYQKV